MAIKTSDNGKSKKSLDFLSHRIDELLKIDNLPSEVLEKINELKNFTEEFKLPMIENYRELKGKNYSGEEVLEIVKDITGFSKWKIDDITEGDDLDLNWFKENFAITFDETNVRQYNFFRNCHSRDEIFLIQIITFPGHFYVSMDTGRVGFSLNDILTEKEMKAEILKNFE